MGRWSQRELRGGGGVNPSDTFPLPAPALTDWDTSISTPDLGNDLVDPGSAPTDGWNLRYQVNGGAFTINGAAIVASGQPIGGLSLGNVVNIQIAWWDIGSDTERSPWSPTRTVIMT